MNSSRVRQVLTLGVACLASFALLAPSASGAQDQQVRRDVAAARAATAAYHHEPFAVTAGYQRTDECVRSPEGAMGYHYVNPVLFGQQLDVRRPQAVLYVPSGFGRRLVAVEYVAIDRDQNLSTDGDRPTLFGRPFAGPMPGHGPGMPIHYDLHAWIWAHNPNGMFAEWNPRLTC